MPGCRSTQMTIKGDRDYFAEHPQYHMYQHPEWPSYEAAARRARSHARPLSAPALRRRASGLAGMGRRPRRRLPRRYPTASVDLAARLCTSSSRRSRTATRCGVSSSNSRIASSTDPIFGRGRDQTDAEFADEAHDAWLADWRFLAGDARCIRRISRGRSRARAAAPVIDKIYRENARRLFPTAWRGTAGSGT